MNRILAAVIAFAMIGLVPLGMAGTATAARGKSLTSDTKAGTHARATRTVTIDVTGGPKTYPYGHLVGHVGGTYKFKKVIVEKRKCQGGSCDFVRIGADLTNAKSRYSERVKIPKTGSAKFRIKVPASGGYDVSYSNVLKAYWT